MDAELRELPGIGDPVLGPSGDQLTVSAPELEPGVYTVEYSVVSAADGHQTSGLFAFAVDPTGANPPPARPTESSAPTADAAAVAARWLALGGGVVLLGMALFWLLSAWPVLRAVRDAPAPPFWLLAAAALVTGAGIVTYLTLAARGLPTPADAVPLDPAAAFGATPFAIAIRVALAASAVALAVSAIAAGAARTRARPVAALLVITVAAVVILGAFSLAGHASSLGGRLHGLLDWLHLLGVAAWLGGLPALLQLAVAGRRLGARETVTPALRRHARIALPAAAVVALSGLANVPAVIGPARDLVGSAYGDLVLGKGLLFSLAVGIGAANWLVLRGRTARRSLALIAAELAVAAVAVLVAATMVTIPPAVSRVPVTTPTGLGAAQLYGTAGETVVHLAVIRPLPGEQRYEVVTRNAADGTPRTDVQKVFLELAAPAGSDLPDQRVELTQSEVPWLWATRGAYTPVVGDWSVGVTVRRSGELDEEVTFPMEVTDRAPPPTLPPADDGIQAPGPLVALWQAIPGGRAGLLAAAIPLLAGGALVLLRRRPTPGSAARSRAIRLAAGALLIVGGVAGIGAASRTLVELANAAPDDVASVVNPVPADDASIARGADLYRANCSSCHGTTGAGDGPALSMPLRDLAALVPQRSDGELVWVIERGLAGTRMPGFALTLGEQDRWDLINHLRAAFDTAVP